MFGGARGVWDGRPGGGRGSTMGGCGLRAVMPDPVSVSCAVSCMYVGRGRRYNRRTASDCVESKRRKLLAKFKEEEVRRCGAKKGGKKNEKIWEKENSGEDSRTAMSFVGVEKRPTTATKKKAENKRVVFDAHHIHHPYFSLPFPNHIPRKRTTGVPADRTQFMP